MARNPSEDDVDYEPQQSAAGTDEGDYDLADGEPGTAADTEREPVGRISGQDEGYGGEQGADARAGGDIGGAAGGRV